MAAVSSLDVTGRLAHMRALTHDRLDNVSKILPMADEKVPFEEYMAKAQLRAESDPTFAKQFESAVKQYKALGG